MYNFPKFFLQITYDFEFNFSHFIPMLGFFFRRKRKPKIFGFKNVMEREIRKNSHFLSALNYIFNFQPAEIIILQNNAFNCSGRRKHMTDD